MRPALRLQFEHGLRWRNDLSDSVGFQGKPTLFLVSCFLECELTLLSHHYVWPWDVSLIF
jgi:hypothetical protein